MKFYAKVGFSSHARPRPRSVDYSAISIALLAASVLVGAAVSKFVDQTERIIRQDGSIQYVSASNYGGVVGLALLTLAGVAALIGVISADSRRLRLRGASTLLALVVLLWAALSTLRGDFATTIEGMGAVAGVLIVIAAVLHPPTLLVLRLLNWVRDISVILMLAAVVSLPDFAQVPCRADKCGAFDSLFVGIFYTENSAAKAVVLLLPAVVVTRSRTARIISLGLAATFILGTGSRTSLASFLLVVAFVAIYGGSVRSAEEPPPARFVRAIPLAMTLLSTILFLTLSGLELTGRGRIYAAIREQLSGFALLLGSGADTMLRIYRQGSLGRFNAVGEHGEVPHLMVQAGILGALGFVAALIAIAFQRPMDHRWLAALGIALAASVQFATEPGWTLTVRTIDFVSLVTVIGLMADSTNGRHAKPGVSSDRGTSDSPPPRLVST